MRDISHACEKTMRELTHALLIYQYNINCGTGVQSMQTMSLPLAPSCSHVVHLLDSCHTFFVILLQIGENILRHRQAFVVSITFFFSSALSLPARRCPCNFSSESWLCIPQSIAIHQSLISLSKKPFNLNGQLHFLEPMPSRFGFFLVLGGLYIPLLSHCSSSTAFLKLIYLYKQ